MEIATFVKILLALSVTLPLTQQAETGEKRARPSYIALVVVKVQHTERRCLATIVAENIVVTAKKCVENSMPTNIHVYPNLDNQEDISIEAPFRVSKIEIHSNSELVALVLRNTIKNDVVRLASLLERRVVSGTKVVAFGYRLRGGRSDYLMRTDYVIVDCQKNGILRARSQNEDRVIYLDNGAPILIENDDSEWEFVGMLHHQANEYASQHFGSLQFTDIAQYTGWIRGIIEQNIIK